MRLSRLTAVAAVVVVVPLASTLTPARGLSQQPIRVLRHAPFDTIRAGSVITISFDRPVAGSIERSANPERFVRLEPKFPATVQWRDPATIRVIPNEPLPPGRRYRITVGKDLIAMDGGRLDAPYEFTLVTRGAALLGTMPVLGTNPAMPPTVLDPRGRVTLVYGAPVDFAAVARVARLEFGAVTGCPAPSIRMIPVRQRKIATNDSYTIRSWMDNANADSQFVRLVELQAEVPPPDACEGTLTIPTFDANDRSEVRYRISTAGRFVVGPANCRADNCYGQPLVLAFSAPVSRSSVAGHVRIDPPIPFTLTSDEEASSRWYLRTRTNAGTTYRVVLDSTVRDIYGRALVGLREVAYTVNDRTPTLGHELGFITVPRQHPVLRMWHVNTDSVNVTVVAIPDSLRAAVLAAAQRLDAVSRLVARVRDTVTVALHLSAPRNEDGVTEFPIPRTLLNERGSTPLIAIRARAYGKAATVGAVGPAAPGGVQTLPEVQIVALGSTPTPYMALVQVTDLLAHARVSDNDGAVFVTDMNTGSPVARAAVTLRDREGQRIAAGITDGTGVARLTPDSTWRRPATPANDDMEWYGPVYHDRGRMHTSFVDVSRGFDRSATPMAVLNYDPWFDGDPAGSDADLIRAMVYPDRAIYRPGETIYLGTIVRRGTLDRLRPLSRGDSVRFRIAFSGPRGGEPVRDTVLPLNAFSTAVDSFVTTSGAPLGNYFVRLDVMDQQAWKTRAWSWFRIAEYRAPQFKASIAMDSAIRFVGDTVPVRVNGTYYFGAPMAKAVVHWSTETERSYGVEIPGLPKTFSVAETPWFDGSHQQSGALLSGVDTLDAKGDRSLRLPTDAGSLLGPTNVTLSASVEDVDRQTVTTTRSTVMHSSEFYVAVRDSVRSWYWRQDVPRTIEVLAVRPDGRYVNSARVDVTVIRSLSRYVRANNSMLGEWRWESDTVSRDSVTTADSIVRFHFTPGRDGWYTVRFSARDVANRPIATSVGGYVLPGAWAGGWGSNPSGLAMKLARDTVAVGDTAVLSFISPFSQAEAWVTVEREGMIAHTRTRVRQGENSIAVGIDQAAIPSATVTLLLVDGSAAWKTDSISRRIRTASTKLVVDRSSKEIHVELTALAPRYAPGDTARVRIQLRDYRRQPVVGQVVLWAVDESILALTDSARLSVADSMYEHLGSRLEFRSTASMLAELGSQLHPTGWVEQHQTFLASRAANLSVSVAAGADWAPVFIARTDFRSTAFYLSSLVTDTNGVVVAAAKLPDNLTTYRLIAVAVDSADRFGGAESSLMATKPLLARSSLPRFLRTGDEFRAGTTVTNQTGTDVSAVVTASAKLASLLGNSTSTLPLANGRTAEVRYDWKTLAEPGDSAVFTFGVSHAPHTDAVKATLPVKPAYSPRYHTIAGVARGTQAVQLMLPPDIDPARSKLTLRVGNLPIPTISAAYDMFQWYPYQCTEQLTSSGRTIVALLRLKRAAIVDSLQQPTAATLRARLQGVVDELGRRQLADGGGIGYWSSSSWTSAQLTAEAGRLMLDARDLGATVRPTVLGLLTDYLKNELSKSSVDSTFGTRRERQRRVALTLGMDLSALHYLRRVGEADEAAEAELVDAQSSMIWQDRVWLAELLSLRDDREEARRILASVWRDVEITGSRAILPDSLFDTYGFESHVRPAARLLMATLAIDSTHPRIFHLVETVIQRTSDKRRDWEWNTQDYAAAAEAMSRVAMWMRASRSDDSVFVRSSINTSKGLVATQVGDNTTATVTLDGLTERDGDWTVLPLQISTGPMMAFYTLTVDEVPRTAPTTPDAKGIIVERWYERFDNGRPVTEVKEGDLIRVRLRVTVPADREYVAVADPLPAGLEVVDMSLRTSGTLGPFESSESRAAQESGNQLNKNEWQMYGRWWGGWWSPWEHSEQRDDRVLYFARVLWKGSYTAQYVARATTAGTFIKPPAHAEEMYNQSLGGRSDGGVFRVLRK